MLRDIVTTIKYFLDSSGFKKGASEVEKQLKDIAQKTSQLKKVQVEASEAFVKHNENLENTVKKSSGVEESLVDMVKRYKETRRSLEENTKALREMFASLKNIDTSKMEDFKEKIELTTEKVARLRDEINDTKHAFKEMGFEISDIEEKEEKPKGKLKEIMSMVLGGRIMGMIARFGVPVASVAAGVMAARWAMRGTMAIEQQLLGVAPLSGVGAMREFEMQRATAIGKKPWETPLYRWGYRPEETLGMYEQLIRTVGVRGYGVADVGKMQMIARGAGIAPEIQLGLLGTVTRGVAFGKGYLESPMAYKILERAIGAGFTSGIDRARLPEFIEASTAVVREAQTRTGRVDVGAILRMQERFGRMNIPALTGMAGAETLSALGQGFTFGEPARTAMVLRAAGYGRGTTFGEAYMRVKKGIFAPGGTEMLANFIREIKKWGPEFAPMAMMEAFPGLKPEVAEKLAELTDKDLKEMTKVKEILNEEKKTNEAMKELEKSAFESMKNFGTEAYWENFKTNVKEGVKLALGGGILDVIKEVVGLAPAGEKSVAKQAVERLEKTIQKFSDDANAFLFNKPAFFGYGYTPMNPDRPIPDFSIKLIPNAMSVAGQQ